MPVVPDPNAALLARLAAIQADILPSSAKDIIDARGRLVLPGMIDTHAHVYKYVSGRFGLESGAPDDLWRLKRIGVHNDVTGTTALFAWRMSGLRWV